MSISQIKDVLHKRIEDADERLLRIMYAMSLAYSIPSSNDPASKNAIEAIAVSPDWQPMSETALLNEIEEANAQIQNGEYTSIEDLEKEMKQW